MTGSFNTGNVTLFYNRIPKYKGFIPVFLLSLCPIVAWVIQIIYKGRKKQQVKQIKARNIYHKKHHQADHFSLSLSRTDE